MTRERRELLREEYAHGGARGGWQDTPQQAEARRERLRQRAADEAARIEDERKAKEETK